MFIYSKIFTTTIIVFILLIVSFLMLKPCSELQSQESDFIELEGMFVARLTNIKVGGLERKEIGINFNPSVKWKSEYFSNPFTGQVKIFDSNILIYEIDLTDKGFAIFQENDSIPSIALKQFPNNISLGEKANIRVEIINFKINGNKPNSTRMHLYYSDSRIK